MIGFSSCPLLLSPLRSAKAKRVVYCLFESANRPAVSLPTLHIPNSIQGEACHHTTSYISVHLVSFFDFLSFSDLFVVALQPVLPDAPTLISEQFVV